MPTECAPSQPSSEHFVNGRYVMLSPRPPTSPHLIKKDTIGGKLVTSPVYVDLLSQ